MAVYFILCPELQLVKIGFATDVKKRLADIGSENPYPVELLLAVEGTRETERRFHGLIEQDRFKGEWFRYTNGVKKIIKLANTLDILHFLSPDRAQIRNAL